MELKSRIVFLDTNIYEQKNFQFSSYLLKSFKHLVDNEQIRLLITSPTIGEVKAHIKEKVENAVAEVKRLRKSAMVLRNVPGMPVYGIFDDLTVEAVDEELNRMFDEFLEGDNVEHVSIEGVSANEVFDRYFSLKAPFAIGEKRKEFSDAYVLLALSELSRKRGWPVHVITTDRDMQRFSEEFPNLICSDSLLELVEAVNKADAVEPAEFSEFAFNKVLDEVMHRAEESLRDITVEIDGDWELDAHVEDVEYADLVLVGKNLVSVDAESCVFNVVFSVDVSTVESVRDYDRSPFDSEEGRYFFVLETVKSKKFKTSFSAELAISYLDRIEDSIEIYELKTPDYLELRNPYEETYRELDINGD
ncbi:PIN domain-containing protein [Pseudomonas aeruginosa]|uniref:PIN domain-containing protein n=1 Tax=Pseudomonas aeruginosa TaxID=287 RepID=UPI000FF39FF7|nr:PIN domain-containing protein [Pseudomonas aeruginosa]NTT31544.1 DUF4935 domain-containing protein [Pseudomonas aeruginosa]RPY15758.1 hypothetical protein IPC694_21460 [Pseudomonas aeruginosa]WCW21945.1 DUF4935 domain-containing protein [Pseudomonas aeruginosa]HBN8384895.1 DUF4935 domain-containing protein [Pseudomonas aeruginosa]HBO4117077.1 DUF4935 domain-containing protein [Pseudomonas aeruginosa]